MAFGRGLSVFCSYYLEDYASGKDTYESNKWTQHDDSGTHFYPSYCTEAVVVLAI